MILATALLTASLGQANVNPGQVISKMFAYYNDATSMSGRIKMTQALGQRVAVIDTTFQFENPAKIYISQVLNASYGNDRWLVTGDGVGFSYTPPRNTADGRQSNRLYEPVQFIPPPPRNKNDTPIPKPPPLDVRQIYAIVTKTLGDRSLPIDVAFGRKEDLAYIKNQIASLSYKGAENFAGVRCHVISGKWRDYANADNGSYTLWIADDGQLKRFERQEHVDLKEQGVAGLIVTVWEVNITKNGGVDPALFKVILKN